MTEPVEMKECSRPGVLTIGEHISYTYEDTQAEDTTSDSIDNYPPVEIVEDKKIFDIRGHVGYLIQQVDRLQRDHSKSSVDYCRLRRILLSDMTDAGIQDKVLGLKDDVENIQETIGQIRTDLNGIMTRVEDGEQQARERVERCRDLDFVLEGIVARICRMETRIQGIQAAQSTPRQAHEFQPPQPQQKIRVRCPNCNRELSKNYLGSHLKKYCKQNTNNNN